MLIPFRTPELSIEKSYIISAVSLPGLRIFGQIRQQSNSPITSVVLTISEQVNQYLKRSVDTNALYSQRYDNVFVLDSLVVFELDNPVRINNSPNGISSTVRVELNLIEWPSTEIIEYESGFDFILNISSCENTGCEIFYQDWTELMEDALESNCGDSNSYALYQTCIGEASAGE